MVSRAYLLSAVVDELSVHPYFGTEKLIGESAECGGVIVDDPAVIAVGNAGGTQSAGAVDDIVCDVTDGMDGIGLVVGLCKTYGRAEKANPYNNSFAHVVSSGQDIHFNKMKRNRV
jgi:hypothetical protein